MYLLDQTPPILVEQGPGEICTPPSYHPKIEIFKSRKVVIVNESSKYLNFITYSTEAWNTAF